MREVRQELKVVGWRQEPCGKDAFLADGELAFIHMQRKGAPHSGRESQSTVKTSNRHSHKPIGEAILQSRVSLSCL